MSDLKQVLAKLLNHPEGNRVTGTKPSKKAAQQRQNKGLRRMIVLKNSHCYRHCLMQLKALGVKPEKKVAGFHTVVCRFPANADMKLLQAHAMVRRVEVDRKMKIHMAACASNSSNQIIPWGVSRIQAPSIWSRYQGGAIRVAVLDTGISGSHPDLRLVRTYNTIAGVPGWDQNGHGTHVAGTIAALKNSFGVVGVAPRVRIHSVKAFGRDGNAFTSDIVQGLDWCIRNNMHIINMSFGMTEESTTVKEAIQRAYKKGIVLVASAGNSGASSGQIDFPGRMPEVISVAAMTQGGGIAGFSSRGAGITVTAPGEGICSTIPGKTYTRMDGTSMAAPHVTGAVALMLAKNRSLSPARIRRLLQETAVSLNGYTLQDQGSGLIQARKAFDRA